jgi:hypothetical protein
LPSRALNPKPAEFPRLAHRSTRTPPGDTRRHGPGARGNTPEHGSFRTVSTSLTSSSLTSSSAGAGAAACSFSPSSLSCSAAAIPGTPPRRIDAQFALEAPASRPSLCGCRSNLRRKGSPSAFGCALALFRNWRGRGWKREKVCERERRRARERNAKARLGWDRVCSRLVWVSESSPQPVCCPGVLPRSLPI